MWSPDYTYGPLQQDTTLFRKGKHTAFKNEITPAFLSDAQASHPKRKLAQARDMRAVIGSFKPARDLIGSSSLCYIYVICAIGCCFAPHPTSFYISLLISKGLQSYEINFIKAQNYYENTKTPLRVEMQLQSFRGFLGGGGGSYFLTRYSGQTDFSYLSGIFQPQLSKSQDLIQRHKLTWVYSPKFANSNSERAECETERHFFSEDVPWKELYFASKRINVLLIELDHFS